ncbi:MAG: DUF4358 domain-containing protein [Eubacteriales bacterium]
MKKAFLPLVLVLILTSLMFYSCGKKQNPDASPKAMFDKAVELLSLDEDTEVYYSETDDGWYYIDNDILSGKFGELTMSPKQEDLVSYAVYFSNSLYETEFGVFRFKSGEKADEMKSYIQSRFSRLLENAVNYPSVDTALIKNYTVVVDGNWVYYAATRDNAGFCGIVEGLLYP